MKIEQNFDLSKLNTFGVKVFAKFFVEINSKQELEELFSLSEFKDNNKLFLGGGSNILFTQDFNGIVVLNKLKGIEILSEDNNSVLVYSMSGEVWHDLVLFAVNREYWGIENLSFIPGTVGGAPMQNIGAYGAELKSTLESVEAYNVESGEKKIFSKEECLLGYRDSIFKNELKNKYFISAITLRLNKIENKNISYKILSDFLLKNKIEIKSVKDISDAVIEIRRSKLPDPKVIGNAGSFFKNVFVEREDLENLIKKYPNLPYFEDGESVKIPAGWLIEECGWKGKRLGNVGVHDKQALVLVNYGGATGGEIKTLATQIINSVYEKFGFTLVPEVNFL